MGVLRECVDRECVLLASVLIGWVKRMLRGCEGVLRGCEGVLRGCDGVRVC